MIFSRKPAVLAAAMLAGSAFAQDFQLSPSTYTDAPTGINFSTWATPGQNGVGEFSFGWVLPDNALTKDSTEYIGRLQCQTINSSFTGWCGIAHGGHMTSDLLLMAWPDQGHVFTSFRWVADYFMPGQFGGDNGTNGTSAAFPAPTLTIISTKANATAFEVLYRCQNCFSWQQGTYNESVHTAGDPGNALVLGYAQAAKGPTNPGCPGNTLNFGFHDNGYAQWGAPVANASRASYTAWTKLATQVPNAAANATAASCKAAAPTAAPSSAPGARRAVTVQW